MMCTAAVVGGRGKTGRAVAAAVAASGGRTRALGRAEMADLPGALRGCESIYLIAPNLHPEEPAFVEEIVGAARRAGITRLVYHSVAAPYEPAMPHHLGKAVSEGIIRRSDLQWTILQPGVYMDNFLTSLRAPEPVLAVPYDPHQRFGAVALSDVGEVAARVLAEEAFAGATLELGGPQLVSIADIAAIGSQVLGREVPVVWQSLEEWTALSGRGLSVRERQWLGAMFDYYDAHGLPCGAVATRGVLGREPMGFTEFLAREMAESAGIHVE